MENIKSYIESGILELYVLGDLNSVERQEVESMSKLHPEVKAELDEIEAVMGNLANEFAVEASLKVKEGFFNSINFVEEKNTKETIAFTTSVADEAKIVGINQKQSNFYKYAFAASVALLLVSVIAIINLNSSLKDSQTQIAQLQNSNQTYANQVNYLDERVNKSEETIGVFTNPDYQMVKLAGSDNSPESNLLVAWNKKEQKVALDMHSMKMPKNDETHQYQLWALVDGKPVDLGVFDADGKETIGLKDMKSIGAAQTFAVTLEPRGGSVNPTLEKLMVIGNI